MKTIKYCVVRVIFLCLSQLSAQTHSQVRMTYINPGVNAIPTKFYERARANGFNYVLAHYWLDGTEWSNGCYVGSQGFKLRERLRDEFMAADNYGLKLIPLFKTSGASSNHWGAAVRDTAGMWQSLPSNIGDTTLIWSIPTFAPDPSGKRGFDYSFNELLEVIYCAFDSARSQKSNFSYKNLDYIHFGGDEPAVPVNIGGTNKMVVMAGLCKNDRDWLVSNGYSISSASTAQSRIVALLGSNIKRKATMIMNAGGRHPHNSLTKYTTTALYFGDMLDPNFLGADSRLCSFTNLSDTVSFAIINIKTTSLVSNIFVDSVKNSSIVVQWNYDSHYMGNDYNTDSTFRYFANNGLRFFHGNALADEADPIPNTRLHQLMEQTVVGTYPRFNNRVLGYVSFHWCNGPNLYTNIGGWYDQKPSYRTMEFLSHILWHNAALFE